MIKASSTVLFKKAELSTLGQIVITLVVNGREYLLFVNDAITVTNEIDIGFDMNESPDVVATRFRRALKEFLA